VTVEYSDREQALREEVQENERVLDGLEQNLRAVDAEFAQLADKHHQYDVLARVCRSLEELDGLGVADLFWDNSDDNARSTRLGHAQREIDAYEQEIARVEGRRNALVNEINEQNSTLDYLHYDLRDVIAEAESRRNEWELERDADELPNRVQIMPWTRSCEEDSRFHRSLTTSLAASVAVTMMLSMIALPLVETTPEIELPERVARLVRKERTPPPPPTPAPEIPVEEILEPEPELVEEAAPETLPEVTEAPTVAEKQPDTREQVKSKGILAFRDSFASRADVRPAAGLGSQARLSNAGQDSVGRPERMMVTTSAPGSSGGINLSNISRDFGGGGGGGGSMGGVAVSQVASAIGGGGGGSNRPLSGGASAGRTDEEIQIVFDRYKASLYRLYNRELRKNPTLRGQLVLRLTIEPDGSVSLCQLHSSDMQAPLLADQVVDRVSTFDFGAKENIVAVTIIYPIDFLPAA
jgi:outer membrane biosynthesis protein TonB